MRINYNDLYVLFSGEIFLLKPIDEISAITHVGDPVLLTVIAEEVKITRDEPPAMATTVQLALFLPERVNSPPYFENDQYVSDYFFFIEFSSRFSFDIIKSHHIYDDSILRFIINVNRNVL